MIIAISEYVLIFIITMSIIGMACVNVLFTDFIEMRLSGYRFGIKNKFILCITTSFVGMVVMTGSVGMVFG